MAVFTAVVLLGSIATTSLQQNQAFAQGVIVPQREEFNKLSEQFQHDVLDLVSADPPTEASPSIPDTIDDIQQNDVVTLAKLFDNYKQETFKIFELEPPDPDAESRSEADPPSELVPPDPDLEPPDPDADAGR